ncbi:cytochrome P450 [Streptomyces sp. ACA25]|uniref:cytochrome P450 n=1 Tax=Streptomyces sp. ACA25 TaxID=3022596 RepID=UPI00230713CD|nr:cytochrome P450 [Streptomyces sp. ACA25]MDB1086506.1 cytochrome P450 [Streptomyces sp. ACA25]
MTAEVSPVRTPYPLYDEEFVRDPYAVYERMRAECGAIAPIELAPGISGWLVLDYRAALDLLHDTRSWTKDSRVWMETVPPDHPVLGMLGWRPNLLFNDGETHARYRQVVTDSLARIEPHRLRTMTQELADLLIDSFIEEGRVDLVSQYCRPIPLYVMNRLFGLADDRAPHLVEALAGLMEGTGPEATALFERYMGELLMLKTAQRGDDITSWFLDHPHQLTPEESLHQLVLTVGAGQEPTTNLVSNALSRLLADDSYRASWTDGIHTPREAVEQVLRHETPVANYGVHYPRRDLHFHGVDLPAHALVMVSFAAAGADPKGPGAAPRGGTRAHLSWSAGPHACPAQQPATLIATTAIEHLVSRLPDLRADLPRSRLEWRPAAFHRSLVALPARFTPSGGLT